MRNRTLLISILLIALFTINVFSLGELSERFLKNADKHYKKALDYLNQDKESESKTEFKKALDYYKKVLEMDSDYLPAFTNITDIYMYQDDYAAAEQFTKDYLKRHKNSVVYFRLATIYSRQEKLDLAKDTYNKILTLPKDFGTAQVVPYVYHNLSEIYEKSFQKTENPADLEKAIELELKALKFKIPGLTFSRIAVLYKKKGDTKAALKAIDEAIAADPKNFELKIVKAAIYEDEKDFDSALKIYDEILSENIDNVRLEQIGVRFFNNKKYKKSAEIFERIISSTPKEDVLQRAYLSAAKSYQALEKEAKSNGDDSLAQEYHSKSQTYFSKVTSGTPGQSDALIQQALDALNSGKYDEAITLYEGVVAKGAADFYVYMDLGNAYFSKKDYQNAETNFKKASGMKVPSKYSFQVYYNLGYTQFILGLVKIKSKDIDEGKRILKDSKENLKKAKTYATSAAQNADIDKRLKQIDQTLKAQ